MCSALDQSLEAWTCEDDEVKSYDYPGPEDLPGNQVEFGVGG